MTAIAPARRHPRARIANATPEWEGVCFGAATAELVD
jgi:hypothetical protein